MFKNLFRGKNLEKEVIFLKVMTVLASADEVSDIEKEYITSFIFRNGKSNANKIAREFKSQNTYGGLEDLVNEVRSLSRDLQNDLLNELITISKLDNNISNEEATVIMIIAEALSFDVNEVMSSLKNHGLDIEEHTNYIQRNFTEDHKNHKSESREVGFLAAKKRYEMEKLHETISYCPECGQKIKNGDFCDNCGTKLG